MIQSAIRQISDIQNQIKTTEYSSQEEHLRSLFIYNTNLKAHLLNHVNDKVIRQKVYEISDFTLEDFRIKRHFLLVALDFIIFYESFQNEKYDYLAARNSLNIICDKYASLEFLMNNSLTSL